MSDTVEMLSLKVARSEEEREAVAAELVHTRTRLDRCERTLAMLGQVCETIMCTNIDDLDRPRVLVQLLAGVAAVVSPITLPSFRLEDRLLL